ncbi:LPP20 family lipoprotein [Chloroherpeton thalassium]|nr:LPP20 family lipoprotein [Chloroherpeton thalassium]
MSRTISFIALAFFLFACAGTQQAEPLHTTQARPDWVEGKSRNYPDAFYMTGVGSGITRATAEQNARANIGKVFKVDLKSQTRTTISEEIQNRQNSSMLEKTTVKYDEGLDKTLEGTEIAEIWRDENAGRYYALAVLEREKAQEILTSRIKELDSEYKSQKAISEQSADKLEKIRSYVQRKSLLNSREMLATDLRVVEPDAVSAVQPGYNIGEERAAIDRFLKNEVKLGLKTDANTPERLVAPFIDALTQRGLSITETQTDASQNFDVLFSLDLERNASNEKVGGWYYCRWNLSISAEGSHSQETLASLSASGRTGQLSVSQATEKAATDALKKLPDLTDGVLKKLFGE